MAKAQDAVKGTGKVKLDDDGNPDAAQFLHDFLSQLDITTVRSTLGRHSKTIVRLMKEYVRECQK